MGESEKRAKRKANFDNENSSGREFVNVEMRGRLII